MKNLFIITILLALFAGSLIAGGTVSANKALIETLDTAVDAAAVISTQSRDSLLQIGGDQATFIKVYVSPPLDLKTGDTTDTQMGIVTDSICWAKSIEFEITTDFVTATPTNVQVLFYHLTGPVITVLAIDTDWDAAVVGDRFIVDLNNFGAALTKAALSKPVADPADGAVVGLPPGGYFRIETGEVYTSGQYELRIVYYSNGGYITDP